MDVYYSLNKSAVTPLLRVIYGGPHTFIIVVFAGVRSGCSF